MLPTRQPRVAARVMDVLGMPGPTGSQWPRRCTSSWGRCCRPPSVHIRWRARRSSSSCLATGDAFDAPVAPLLRRRLAAPAQHAACRRALTEPLGPGVQRPMAYPLAPLSYRGARVLTTCNLKRKGLFRNEKAVTDSESRIFGSQRLSTAAPSRVGLRAGGRPLTLLMRLVKCPRTFAFFVTDIKLKLSSPSNCLFTVSSRASRTWLEAPASPARTRLA